MQVNDWRLTPERAAVHPESATAVVADTHLGYDQTRRRGGEAVPLRGLQDHLAPLTRLVRRERIRRLVVAGDLYENARHSRVAEQLLPWLEHVGVELLVVPGNHDRGLTARPGLLTVCPDGVRVGGWHVVHGDRPGPQGAVVQGHLHPCVRWGRLSAPCYLVTEEHLILPAFTPEASGWNVLAGSRWGSYRCGVIAGEEVLDFGFVSALRKQHGSPGGRPGPP